MKRNIIMYLIVALVYLFYLIILDHFTRTNFASGLGLYFLLFISTLQRKVITNKWENELPRDLLFIIVFIVVIIGHRSYIDNCLFIAVHSIFVLYNIILRIIIHIRKDLESAKNLSLINIVFLYILVLHYFKNA